jgi:hypothetical protein
MLLLLEIPENGRRGPEGTGAALNVEEQIPASIASTKALLAEAHQKPHIKLQVSVLSSCTNFRQCCIQPSRAPALKKLVKTTAPHADEQTLALALALAQALALVTHQDNSASFMIVSPACVNHACETGPRKSLGKMSVSKGLCCLTGHESARAFILATKAASLEPSARWWRTSALRVFFGGVIGRLLLSCRRAVKCEVEKDAVGRAAPPSERVSDRKLCCPALPPRSSWPPDPPAAPASAAKPGSVPWCGAGGATPAGSKTPGGMCIAGASAAATTGAGTGGARGIGAPAAGGGMASGVCGMTTLMVTVAPGGALVANHTGTVPGTAPCDGRWASVACAPGAAAPWAPFEPLGCATPELSPAPSSSRHKYSAFGVWQTTRRGVEGAAGRQKTPGRAPGRRRARR